MYVLELERAGAINSTVLHYYCDAHEQKKHIKPYYGDRSNRSWPRLTAMTVRASTGRELTHIIYLVTRVVTVTIVYCCAMTALICRRRQRTRLVPGMALARHPRIPSAGGRVWQTPLVARAYIIISLVCLLKNCHH